MSVAGEAAEPVGELAEFPCRDVCAWAPAYAAGGAPVAVRGLPLFTCRGCGSQWTRAEAWTPAQANGRVSRSVAAEAARRPARKGRRRR